MKPVEQLAEWVSAKHDGQLIKRTTAPYYDHVLAVARMAGQAVSFGYEIGLCHDLLEDTDTSAEELHRQLEQFGYAVPAAELITAGVVELTDRYTAEMYPDLSKSIRKRLEAARLLTISPTAQTVKYADLIYNINWVLAYDLKHAQKYLKKKRLLLLDMNRGDKELWMKAMELTDRVEL